jgi:hypothetical protein
MGAELVFVQPACAEQLEADCGGGWRKQSINQIESAGFNRGSAITSQESGLDLGASSFKIFKPLSANSIARRSSVVLSWS